jgi:DNA modification methylase
VTSINNLKSDHKNARKRTDRSAALIAESLKRYGAARSIVIDEDNRILAGNGTIEGAKAAGIQNIRVIETDGTEIIAVKRTGLTEDEKIGLALADNRTSDLSDWDKDMLQQLSEEHDIAPWFDADDLAEILGEVEQLPAEGLTDADDVPEAPEEPVTKLGDVWLLGKHRVMCGDSTVITDVERLMDGAKAALMHADPPYGMGKASDGVANDNLYNDDLDAFQMEWWATLRPFLLDNASAYIWGNAPELWRLWYKAGLGTSEMIELRNQIVWDKKAIPGMASPDLTQFPIASEHCLFFALGQQFRGNVNQDGYPQEWDAVRLYLADEAAAAKITSQDIKDVCGVQMFSHWFTTSQFNLIPEKHYATLQAAYPGRFLRPWRQLKAEWDKVKSIPTQKVQEARSYFDNAHDVMRDVWEFSRVNGEERHGHATPKPVAMMERVMKSSLHSGGLCVEPFGGSGSTLIGAEKAGRVCYAMELNPVYVDVIVKRWEDFTGNTAVCVPSDQHFTEQQEAF